MRDKVTDEDLELLSQLGVDTAPAPASTRTPRQQRIIAGFEEIERFVEEHGREPEHGENRGIFERIYAVRLDRIRESEECREVLKNLDTHQLLRECAKLEDELSDLSDEELLATLGADEQPDNDVTRLVHVRSRDEIRAAEEIAQRNPCKDFDQFRTLFDKIQEELGSGVRESIKYKDNAEVRIGDFFILDGQKVVVAEMGEPFVTEYGRPDRRLRVVYDNGTESDLLVRSLQRALNKDKASRRITELGFGPLFGDIEEEGDLSTGYIYVLRSKSDHPFVAQHRTVIHKIGVTKGDVKQRIANAKKDPTYLLSDVELVETFKLANVNAKKLEGLLQKFFSSAQLDLELKDRFGGQVEPREWFLLPLPAIEEAVARLKDGTLPNFCYNPETAQVEPVG